MVGGALGNEGDPIAYVCGAHGGKGVLDVGEEEEVIVNCFEPRVGGIISVKEVGPGILGGGSGLNKADEVGKALISNHVKGRRRLECAANGMVRKHVVGVFVFVLSEYGAVGGHNGVVEHLIFATAE